MPIQVLWQTNDIDEVYEREMYGVKVSQEILACVKNPTYTMWEEGPTAHSVLVIEGELDVSPKEIFELYPIFRRDLEDWRFDGNFVYLQTKKGQWL